LQICSRRAPFTARSEAELTQKSRIPGPVFPDLDPEFEHHLAAEQLFDVGPGRGTNLLELAAALADDNSFL